MTPTRKVSPNFSPYARLREIASRRAKTIAFECPSLPVSGEITTLAVPGFRVIESHHPAELHQRRHCHERAQIIYVVEGRCSETYDGENLVAGAPRTLRYLPPRLAHSNSFEAGSRCLIVEIEPETLARVDKHSKTLGRPGEIQSPTATWLAQRLHQEFLGADTASVVSLEGILLEMLAEAARHAGSGPVRNVPEWLRAAREYVEANFLRPLSLAEVARVARVNRVHLARQFRAYFSTSVGEFLRRKRVEHACHLVTTTNHSLAEVAIDCGFSDQSHFSSIFRRQMGLTPARFREMAHSSPQNRSAAAGRV